MIWFMKFRIFQKKLSSPPPYLLIIIIIKTAFQSMRSQLLNLTSQVEKVGSISVIDSWGPCHPEAELKLGTARPLLCLSPHCLFALLFALGNETELSKVHCSLILDQCVQMRWVSKKWQESVSLFCNYYGSHFQVNPCKANIALFLFILPFPTLYNCHL